MSIALGVVAAAVVATILVSLFPKGAERWLNRLLLARKVVFGIAVFILALFLLATGTALLPFIGGAILVLIFAYLLIDPENQLSDLNPL